jgi:hypothetical protein
MYGYCKNCGSPIETLNEDLIIGSSVCDSRCHVQFVRRNFNENDPLKDEINASKRVFMDNLYSLCHAFLKNGKDINLLIRSLRVCGFITKEDFMSLLENEFGMSQDKECTAFTEELDFQKENPNVGIPQEHIIHLDADVESLDEVLTIIYDSNKSFADLLPENSFIKESRVFPKFLI